MDIPHSFSFHSIGSGSVSSSISFSDSDYSNNSSSSSSYFIDSSFVPEHDVLDKICLIVAGCFYITVLGGIIQTVVISIQEKQRHGTFVRKVMCLLLLLPLFMRALDMTLDYRDYYDRPVVDESITVILFHGLPVVTFTVPLCYVMTFWYVLLRMVVLGEHNKGLGYKIFLPVICAALVLWCVTLILIFHFAGNEMDTVYVSSLFFALGLSVLITIGFGCLGSKLYIGFRRATTIERASGNWVYGRDKTLIGKFGFLSCIFSVSSILKSLVLVILFYAKPDKITDMIVQTTMQVFFEFFPAIATYFVLSEPLVAVYTNLDEISKPLLLINNSDDDEIY